MLDAEADQICGAGRYERSEARRDTRAGSYERTLQTSAGKVPSQGSKAAAPDLRDGDHRTLPPAGELSREALIEMYLAGISVRRVEDITEAL